MVHQGARLNRFVVVLIIQAFLTAAIRSNWNALVNNAWSIVEANIVARDWLALAKRTQNAPDPKTARRKLIEDLARVFQMLPGARRAEIGEEMDPVLHLDITEELRRKALAGAPPGSSTTSAVVVSTVK